MFDYLLAAAAGFVAGIVNVVAGGGSMVSLPALLFLGLSSTDANATNRLAIFLQNVVAVWRYRAHGVGDWRLGLALGLVACPSAVAGAWSASVIPDQAFRRVMGVIFLALLVSLFWTPRSWADARSLIASPRWRRPVLFLAFFLLGFYGGFIQVGIGILILATLVRLGGEGLVRANGIKVLVVFVYTTPALLTFWWQGEVDLRIGLALAAGNMAGAWVGTSLAVKRGESFIRGVVAVVLVASAAKLLLD